MVKWLRDGSHGHQECLRICQSVTWLSFFWGVLARMETEKLVKMANQIGDFFEANPNVEEAKMEIASHLKKFWNSVMITQIVAHVQSQAETGLHPKVLAAISQHLKNELIT